MASQRAISFASHLRSKVLLGNGSNYSRNTGSAKIFVDSVRNTRLLWPNNFHQVHCPMFPKNNSGKQDNTAPSFLLCLLRFQFFLCLGVRNPAGKENKYGEDYNEPIDVEE